MNYNDWRKQLSPPFLNGPNGRKLNEAQGEQEDSAVATAKAAVRARYPSEGLSDALPSIGADRVLEQVDGEPSDQYAARLIGAFSTWYTAGTAASVLKAYELVGQYAPALAGWKNAKIITNADWVTAGGVPPDGDTTKWARWWLVLPQPNVTPNGKWGALSAHKWGDPVQTWGTSANAATVNLARRLGRKWEGAHNRFMGVFISRNTSTEIDTVPSSTWIESNATIGGEPVVFWRFG